MFCFLHCLIHTHKNIIKSVNENLVILDLSTDFRLSNVKTYEKWYNVKHESKNLLKNAVYGLSEIFRDQIKTSNINCMSRLLSYICFIAFDTKFWMKI